MKLIVLVYGFTCCACAVASGEVTGGQPVFDAGSNAPPDPTDAAADSPQGPSTWTALYADYFGPTGLANCSSLSTCHGSAMATGAGTSGFVCGTSKDECWQGMTVGTNCVAAVPPCPIVQGKVAETTGLYNNLHKVDATGKQTGTMPLNGATLTAKGYVFSPSDVARISAWIAQGAPNN